NWSFQLSRGWIKSPEELNPDEDVNRTTASALYSIPFGDEKYIVATALWGLNAGDGNHKENALLLEATLRLNKLAVYTRYEWAQKSGEELDLNPTLFDSHKRFGINELTLGTGYDLFSLGKIRFAGGAQLTAYKTSDVLNTLYGKYPFSGQVFLRVYPSLMKM